MKALSRFAALIDSISANFTENFSHCIYAFPSIQIHHEACLTEEELDAALYKRRDDYFWWLLLGVLCNVRLLHHPLGLTNLLQKLQILTTISSKQKERLNPPFRKDRVESSGDFCNSASTSSLTMQSRSYLCILTGRIRRVYEKKIVTFAWFSGKLNDTIELEHLNKDHDYPTDKPHTANTAEIAGSRM